MVKKYYKIDAGICKTCPKFNPEYNFCNQHQAYIKTKIGQCPFHPDYVKHKKRMDEKLGFKSELGNDGKYGITIGIVSYLFEVKDGNVITEVPNRFFFKSKKIEDVIKKCIDYKNASVKLNYLGELDDL